MTEEIWSNVDGYIKRRYFPWSLIRKGNATVKAFFDGIESGRTFQYARDVYVAELKEAAKKAGYIIIKPKHSRGYYAPRTVKAISIEGIKIPEAITFNPNKLDIPKEVTV